MIKFNRVCIPLGLDCNISCKYCYRDINRLPLPSKLNDLMMRYLKFLSPEWCTALVMSGGEPLLYLDKIKEIFSIADQKIHKKIMTNGILLTEDVVRCCNDNQIEVHVSHDGAATKELRGIDILEDPKKKELIKSINTLRIVGVVTNKNCDVIANYRDTVKKLDGRQNFMYDPCPIIQTPKNESLIKNFDYITYQKSMIEFNQEYRLNTPFYKKGNNKEYPATYGYNVDLNGNIICTETLSKYGTVKNTKEEIFAAAEKSGDGDYCDSQIDCPIRGRCCGMKACASPHMCKIFMADRIVTDYFN